MLRPDGRTAPVALHLQADEVQWSYGGTELSGIYSLRGASQFSPPQFAVNVDAVESDLSKVDPQSLPPQLTIRNTGQHAPDTGAGSVQLHTAWHEHLLWIALTLLFVESFLAWQFGRGVA
jgi:hypothetical protein